MKSVLRYILINIFVVALIIAGIFSINQKPQKNDNLYPIPNLQDIKNKFEKVHSFMTDELAIIESLIDNNDELQNYFFIENNKLFEDKKVGFFVYKNNELKYWTTNDIPLPTSTTPFFFKERVLNLNNGWYSLESVVKEDYHIIGLFQIKQEYSYQNDLLSTGFNPELNIGENFDIISDSVKNAIPVKLNNEAKSSFYLIPIDKPVIFEQSKKFCYLQISLWVLLFLSLLFLIYFLYRFTVNKLKTYTNLISFAFIFAIFLARYYLLLNKLPTFLKEYKLFSPELFAESLWLPSLGDYIINIVLFAFIVVVFVRNLKIKPIIKSSPLVNILFSFSISILAGLCTVFILDLLHGLVWNSSISFSFNNIINLSIYSFTGLLIITTVIASCLIILDKLINDLKTVIKFKTFTITFLVITIFNYLNQNNFNLYTNIIVFFLAFYFLFIFIAFVRLNNKEYSFYKFAIIIFLISTITAEQFTVLSENKQKDAARVIAYNLATERDIGAEFFLNEVHEEIISDKNIVSHTQLRNYNKMNSLISDKILSNRYLNKYELQITICHKNDSLIIEPDFISVDCFEFFNGIKKRYGINLPGTNFYYLDNHNGRISYFGEYKYFDSDSVETVFYIELNSKLFSEGLGYPELLLEKKLSSNQSLKNYNYAKYHNNKLVTSKGEFKYPVSVENHLFIDENEEFFVYQGYLHFVFKPDNQNIIVLSSKQDVYTKELVSFSYIFAIIFMVFSLIWTIYNFKNILQSTVFTLKTKIQSAFISILVVSLIITASISIYFIVEGYQTKQNEFLEDKVQSILIELEHEFVNHSEFTVSDVQYLNFLLIKLSNVFYTDINLYDTDGRLFATSRRELYNHGLKGRYLEPEAYRKLILENSGAVILNEQIGKVNYLSAYIPFRNNDNEIIAYLNLPYFARQNEFKEEISNFIVAFSNVFLILVLVSVIFGIIISKQVTRPLSLVQEKIRLMDINKKAEKIKYDKNDELGGLVREYNRKVDELTESVNKLAQSEREMAWREMAKQIAHEIKNPLTPMKLSVQYLEHTYDNKDEKWEKTFKRVSKTIIEQIDVLSNIATEFSNFAKMPTSHKTTNSIVSIINNCVQLFKSIENIRFITSVNISSKGNINADKEQMTRVFNNLIKNSIQSIPDDKEGIITITVNENEKYYIISVKDNGTGISDTMIPKIFQPNFTTKSGGMGLGLSMVKNIIDNNDGAITFNTEKNVGTEFIIQLPKKEDTTVDE